MKSHIHLYYYYFFSDKADLIKSAMKNFVLPVSACPDWAKQVPEDKWKEHLLSKLKSSNSSPNSSKGDSK